MKQIRLKAETKSVPLSNAELKEIVGGKTNVHDCICNLYDSEKKSIPYVDTALRTSAAMTPFACDQACNFLCDQNSCTDYNVYFHFEEAGS
ncbi:MAG: hypothetical protein J6I36_08705 [Bacteroidaceae bacterium]|nr:hypothetical protein [Bacteroidaceae bacterium]